MHSSVYLNHANPINSAQRAIACLGETRSIRNYDRPMTVH